MKTIRLILILIPVVVLALLPFSATVLLADGGPEIQKHVSGDGGGTMSGGNVVLSGTLGQTAVGIASGGDIYLSGGFWQSYTPFSDTDPASQGAGGEIRPAQITGMLAYCLASGLLLLLVVYLAVRSSRQLR